MERICSIASDQDNEEIVIDLEVLETIIRKMEKYRISWNFSMVKYIWPRVAKTPLEVYTMVWKYKQADNEIDITNIWKVGQRSIMYLQGVTINQGSHENIWTHYRFERKYTATKFQIWLKKK